MSASERLRALADYEAIVNPGDYIDRLDVVTDALPLIADCIEGAEGMIDSRFDPERWKWNRENLVAALAKLEEALDGSS